MDTKYAADTKIANSRRQYEMQKANFDMEVNARVCAERPYTVYMLWVLSKAPRLFVWLF